MNSAIFSHAFKESARLRRVLPWLFMGLLCGILAVFWNNFSPAASAMDRYVSVVGMAAVRVLALGSAIMTTAVIGGEIENRTIVYLLTRPIPRWRLLLVRFLASALVVFLLASFAFWATSLGAFRGAGNPLLVRDLAIVLLGALAYGSLFLFISLAVNRALIWCILFAFGWESAVPNMPGDLYRVSILSHLQAAMQHPSYSGSSRTIGILSGEAGINTISRSSGLMVLVVLTVAMLALSAWWFTKFEFVPREDAE